LLAVHVSSLPIKDFGMHAMLDFTWRLLAAGAFTKQQPL
jgi:hypothetical protein